MKIIDLRDMHEKQITKEIVDRRLELIDKKMAVILNLIDLINSLYKLYPDLPNKLSKVTKKEDRIIGFKNGYMTVLKNMVMMINAIMEPQDIEEIFNNKEFTSKYRLLIEEILTTKFATDELYVDEL